jgi:hypothetical protein
MNNVLNAAALLGLVFLVFGAVTIRLATNPPAAYIGTISAGIGVLLLAVQGFGRLMGCS